MPIASSDHRHFLKTLLLRYRAADDADRAQRDLILTFVESTPDCFERSHAAGHITGSAWVVDNRGERVLLTHHKKLNKWLQLGGHSDGHFDTLAVALREAEEESGLKGLVPVSNEIFDLDVHPIPARPNEPAHRHYDVRFAFRATGSETFVVSNESNQLAWIKISEMAAVSSEESMLRMASKWRLTLPKIGHTQ